MKERPILFSAPMVRALLAGTKTQTRRICKPAMAHNLSHVVEVPDPQERGQIYNGTTFGDEEGGVQFSSPYGGVRDRLWVREAWAETRLFQASGTGMVVYRESDNRTDYGGPWKPSIHMRRRDSRILLEITSVRVERLQDISEADAIAEGLISVLGPCKQRMWETGGDSSGQFADPRTAYRMLWEQINGPGSWDANPWVWAVEFKVIKQEAS